MKPWKPGNSPELNQRSEREKSRQKASGVKNPREDFADSDKRCPGFDDCRRCMWVSQYYKF